MDIQRAAELLAARSTKDFGNALKDRGDPFKDYPQILSAFPINPPEPLVCPRLYSRSIAQAMY